MKHIKLFEEFQTAGNKISGEKFSSDFEAFKQNNLKSLSKLINKTVKVTYEKKYTIIGKVVWVGTNEGSESDFAFSIQLSPNKKLNNKEDLDEFDDWYGEDNMIDLDKDVNIEY
jgi:hypothetical protein